jgi:hypothetical protein
MLFGTLAGTGEGREIVFEGGILQTFAARLRILSRGFV